MGIEKKKISYICFSRLFSLSDLLIVEENSRSFHFIGKMGTLFSDQWAPK